MSDQGSALSQTTQIEDLSSPPPSVGDLADAGNVVVIGRKVATFLWSILTGGWTYFEGSTGVLAWDLKPATTEVGSAGLR